MSHIVRITNFTIKASDIDLFREAVERLGYKLNKGGKITGYFNDEVSVDYRVGHNLLGLKRNGEYYEFVGDSIIYSKHFRQGDSNLGKLMAAFAAVKIEHELKNRGYAYTAKRKENGELVYEINIY